MGLIRAGNMALSGQVERGIHHMGAQNTGWIKFDADTHNFTNSDAGNLKAGKIHLASKILNFSTGC
jgi:hypothetical protein